MPIHLSIGFVVEASPKAPWQSVCAMVGDAEAVAVLSDGAEIDVCMTEGSDVVAVWSREDGSDCGGGM